MPCRIGDSTPKGIAFCDLWQRGENGISAGGAYTGAMSIQEIGLHLRHYGDEQAQHSHDHHQLVLPLQGRLALAVETRAGEVGARQAAIIPAGCAHAFAAVEENRFLVADLPAPLVPSLEVLPTFVELDAALLHYVRFLQLQLEARSSSESQRQMLLLLVQLLQERNGQRPEPDRRIAAARHFMDEHFQRRISTAELAAVAHLSIRQFNALFREQLGRSPHQYLLERRMQSARQLLETTGLSIQQIADAVGYASLSSFSEGFSRYHGKPPSHFRRKAEKERPPAENAPR